MRRKRRKEEYSKILVDGQQSWKAKPNDNLEYEENKKEEV
jgi:hypothetical protein